MQFHACWLSAELACGVCECLCHPSCLASNVCCLLMLRFRGVFSVYPQDMCIGSSIDCFQKLAVNVNTQLCSLKRQRWAIARCRFVCLFVCLFCMPCDEACQQAINRSAEIISQYWWSPWSWTCTLFGSFLLQPNSTHWPCFSVISTPSCASVCSAQNMRLSVSASCHFQYLGPDAPATLWHQTCVYRLLCQGMHHAVSWWVHAVRFGIIDAD